MTISMNLEVEVGLGLKEIISVLTAENIEHCISNADVTGNFPRSNAYFVFYDSSDFPDVMVEGAGMEWKVGTRGVFHCPVSALAENSEDIKSFLLRLADSFGSRFVLSFQYESIYSVRDKSGLHFLRDMVN
ncbi:hypothetical protein [Pseudomonas indica]|jgi:hypothetical protein|uniref:hypothetical protein n=1 Tax=Pseudomonas indica TaxID=137658 RepID=UPI003FD4059C